MRMFINKRLNIALDNTISNQIDSEFQSGTATLCLNTVVMKLTNVHFVTLYVI